MNNHLKMFFSKNKLIVIGVFVHVVLALSIFDIYFTSPVVHVVKTYKNDFVAPAKRLVLMVADGLRAESLFGENYNMRTFETKAPFLRHVAVTKGTWGTSHTRVPTESRPGHVALIAGFYEDPSAVTKGWKENLVEFDSIFNRSKYTWAWGSPDIVPPFSKAEHVFAQAYSPEEQDFSGKTSTSLLDTWVFDKFQLLILKSEIDKKLHSKLNEDGVVFFLHLLGLDTAGHTHKPHSKELLENIRVVNDGIERVVKQIEDFYGNDGKTAFVFTTDHGMTDWGSHGAGSKFETETPFIAWGAGIANTTKPIDIQQADVTPLMATLIGLPIPVNSVGILPVQILNLNEEQITKSLYTNTLQIVAQYETKRFETERDLLFFLYVPFGDLPYDKLNDMKIIIEKNIFVRKYNAAMENCYDLMNLAKKGLNYYHNYYQSLLLGCATMSYIGWIILLMFDILILEPKSERYTGCPYDLQEEFVPPQKLHTLIYTGFIQVVRYILNTHFILCCTDRWFFDFVIVVVFLIWVQSLPTSYYIYTLMPIFLWWSVIEQIRKYRLIIRTWIRRNPLKPVIFQCLLYIIGIELMVACFFDRRILALPLLMIGYFSTKLASHKNIIKGPVWYISCLSLTIFPFISVVGSYFSMILIGLTGVLWIVISLIVCQYNFPFTVDYLDKKGKRYLRETKSFQFLVLLQCIIILIAIINLFCVNYSISNKEGLLLVNQCVSWILLVLSPIIPLCGSVVVAQRLMHIVLSFLVPFMLLSVTYEPLFLLALCINLFLWLTTEYFFRGVGELPLTSFKTNLGWPSLGCRNIVNHEDFRLCYSYLLYIMVSFFGTGSMASLNSFDPMWVRNFITVFNPMMMTVLIIFKMIIPFLIVTCVFRAILVLLRAPVRKLFFIVVIFCDLMGMNFLYFVKNTGSWLEIGTSISHFVIMQTIVVVLLLFYYIAIIITETDVHLLVST